MTDADYEYWEICVGEALDEADIDLPPDDKFKILVEAIQGCAEVQHEAMGRDCIPNPLTLEIQQLQEQLKQGKEAAENREYIYKNAIAARYGYPEEVSVDIVGGRVEVEEVPR